MVENNPLISVIVPVYNIAGRVPALLESLKCQSYENLEIVIYDDASADTIKELISKISLWNRDLPV